MAKDLGANAKLPAVKDLCRTGRVSVSTLDRVLRQLEGDGIVRRKHGHGIYVTPHVHQKTIGLVSGADIFAPYFSSYWVQILQAARACTQQSQNHFRFYLDLPHNTDSAVTRYDLLDDLRAERLDGLLFYCATEPHQLEQLLRWNIPIVDLSGSSASTHKILDDHTAMIALAVQSLKTAGCARLAHLGMLAPGAFQAAVETANLTWQRDWDWDYRQIAHEIPHTTREEFGYRWIKRIHGAANPASPDGLPDGLVSSDDTMTRGALMALREVGGEAGRRLKIASHANKGSPILKPYEEQLTLIEFDPEEIVKTAFDMLLLLMDGKQPPQPVVTIQPQVRPPADIAR